MYELIEHYRVPSGGVSTVVLSGIPGIYTDLLLQVSARSDVNAASGGNVLLLGFNTSYSNISGRILDGNGSTTSSFTDSYVYIVCGANDYTASTFGNSNVYISNYTSSTAKSISMDGVGENNATAARLNIKAGLWNPGTQAPITSLTINPINAPTGKILQNSTFTLYGINRTSGIGRAPLAMGGYMSYSNGYWVHTFPSSGSFIPFTNMEVDYLIVGGGGGAGGGWASGGGGAGGYREFTSQSLTGGTNYSVVVGAGGPGTSSYPGPATSGSSSSFNSSTSAGGGASYTDNVETASLSGGSGAGGSYNALGGAGNTPSTSPSQGNSGGKGSGWDNGNNTVSGGGGGGAGGAGKNGAFSVGGAGGDGQASSITGTAVFRAGGGGGGAASGSGGTGGVGGGGRGGVGDTSVGMTAGTANTGGGGGGYGRLSGVGGAGGSGIVIVRYKA